jgi:hypothetical protein
VRAAPRITVLGIGLLCLLGRWVAKGSGA